MRCREWGMGKKNQTGKIQNDRKESTRCTRNIAQQSIELHHRDANQPKWEILAYKWSEKKAQIRNCVCIHFMICDCMNKRILHFFLRRSFLFVQREYEIKSADDDFVNSRSEL